MNATINRLARVSICFVGTMLLMLCLGNIDLHAQRFQTLHGDTCTEYGQYKVHQVSTGGYVAVGYSNSTSAGCSDYDVYVVRLSYTAALMWSMTYDINGGGGNDYGHSIIENNAGGFTITGYTDNAGSTCGGGVATSRDIFLLRINNVGGIIGVNTYGANNTIDVGVNVIQTTLAAGGGTAAGDYVIAGYTRNSLGNTDAYLLRVTAGGGLIWDRAYNGTGHDEFTDVVESVVGAGASQLIVCGRSNSFTANMNGLLARVNGGTGALVGNAGLYGGAIFTQFTTLQELQIAPHAGQIVTTGATVRPTTSNALEIYTLKTTANPCVRVVDITHGDLGSRNDEGTTIREVRPPAGSTLTAGRLVITGQSSIRTGGNGDAFLLEVSPVNLNTVFPPAGAGFNLYGQGSAEKGISVTPVYNPVAGIPTNGYMICGGVTATSSALTLLTPPDPSQLYLIKTDRVGSSNCNTHVINPLMSVPAYNATCVAIPAFALNKQCQNFITLTSQSWIKVLCFINPKLANSSGSETEASMNVRSYPNPVLRGSQIQLEYALVEAAQVRIVVTDVAGATIYETTVEGTEGANMMPLNTGGWSNGTYLVTLSFGDESQTQKIVVMD